MKLALIGLGKWGKNIQKTLEGLGVEVSAYDPSLPRSKQGEPPLRTLRLGSQGPREGRKSIIDGVLIATPGSTHAKVALPFIKQGLPVFIEKPMTTSLKDAKKLQAAAKKSGSLVMVGHVHLYNPAFLKAKELVKKAGKIRYASFEGMNWGPFRDDMSAMWDWAPHDIAMALELFGQPKSVQAWREYDWAEIKLEFKSFSAVIHVSSLSPEKRKKMMVAGEKHSVLFDDVSDRKVSVHKQGQVSYPDYGKTMPLTGELAAFIQMIKTKKKPKTDIQNGVEVVRILDAAERSVKGNGKVIRL